MSEAAQLDKLVRYLINCYGDVVKVDDMPNESAVDEAIKILEQFRVPHRQHKKGTV